MDTIETRMWQKTRLTTTRILYCCAALLAGAAVLAYLIQAPAGGSEELPVPTEATSAARGQPTLSFVEEPGAQPWLGQGAAGVQLRPASPMFDGDEVEVPLTSASAYTYWWLTDVQGRVVANGAAQGSDVRVKIGWVPPGLYYFSAAPASDAPPEHRTTMSVGVLGPVEESRDPSDKPPFGVTVHVDKNSDVANLTDAVSRIGFGHVRFDLSWADIEKSQKSYSFPNFDDEFVRALTSRGVSPLPVADYANPLYDGGRTPSSSAGIDAYADFAAAALAHYQPSLTSIEIYNEFNSRHYNNGSCGLTAACYARLFKATEQKIHAALPAVAIVGGATSGVPLDWLQELFSQGVLPGMQAISVHPYQYPGPPEPLKAELASLRDLVARADDAQHLGTYVTELGWPTGGEQAVTETTQADYLIRSEALALASGVRQFYWYDLVNDGTNPNDPEANFGLMYGPGPGVTAYTPKPAAVAQATVIRKLRGLTFEGFERTSQPTVFALRFGDGDQSTQVLWATTPTTISLASRSTLVIADEFGTESTVQPAAGGIRIELGEHPIFVTGPVTG